ncbi:MAG: DUF5908 family protein [Pricia sp.]
MPIQVKELVIRATVDENSGSENSPAPEASPESALDGKNRERLIRQCVDEVLEILRLQNER